MSLKGRMEEQRTRKKGVLSLLPAYKKVHTPPSCDVIKPITTKNKIKMVEKKKRGI